MHQVEKAAVKYADETVCVSMMTATGGFPVCGTIKFLVWGWNHLWDLDQKTPSSQSGPQTTWFKHPGLGGDINTLYVNLYDPYNYPAVTIFEWDSCHGESQSLGARNFTYYPSDGSVTEEEATTFEIKYPAMNGDSFSIPYNVQITLYHNDKW